MARLSVFWCEDKVPVEASLQWRSPVKYQMLNIALSLYDTLLRPLLLPRHPFYRCCLLAEM